MNINGTSGTPGLNVNELFNSGLDSISSKGKDLQAKMTEMLGIALVRHEEHDGYDEEPCPAYRLSLSPVRNHVPGPHPGCFCVAPSRAWRVGRDDGQGEGAVPFSPFCV